MDIGASSYNDINSWTTRMISFNNTATPAKGITFQDVLKETDELDNEIILEGKSESSAPGAAED